MSVFEVEGLRGEVERGRKEMVEIGNWMNMAEGEKLEEEGTQVPQTVP